MVTVSLYNPQHSECLLREANRLRMSGALCDVVICVGHQEFRAHSLVLACVSPTLQELFRSPGSRYSLDFLASRTFERILEYAYTERLEVQVAELGDLLHSARILAMDGLEEQIMESTARLGVEEREPGHSPLGIPTPDTTVPSSQGSPQREPAPVSADPRAEASVSSCSTGSQLRGSVITGPGSQKRTKGPRHPTPVRPHASHPPPLPPPIAMPLQAPSALRHPPPPPHPAAYLRSLGPGSFPGPGALGTPVPDGSVRRSQQDHGNGAAFRGRASNEDPAAVDARQRRMEVVNLFPCEFCGKRFLDSFRLCLHQQSHLGCGVIVCNVCGLRMTMDQEAMAHHHSHSGGAKMPIYLLCGKGLQTRLSLRHRAPSQAGGSWNYSCQECQRLFPSLTALKRHIKSHTGGGAHQCQYCHHQFADEAALKSHKQVHQGEKPYQCGQCKKKFTLKHQLETHYRIHTGEKPFECKLCHQRSRDYSAMIKHLRTHNGALPYQCTICQEFCPSLSAMQKHIKSHLPEEVPPNWTLEESYLYLCDL
ncbi:zinc finger and BTB domain-containing protein 16-like [Stegostoma tigrinum]|uniref:zinc finger and BTB domain-containing protein 16-like n=1 Tax=Stegostoma tigrinum TaxID=3053191 RepID=UPI0028706B98|nr:zinc finger and BTB domain-containing protein 16-like [Stegostoma tigrinum]